LASIESSATNAQRNPITVLAACVFSPQKGASSADVDLLNRGLEIFLSVAQSKDQPGYGAAGGVSAGLAKTRGIDSMVVCGVNKNGDNPNVFSLAELAPSVDAAITECKHWLEVAGGIIARRYTRP
jgi:hypothetical protein